MHAVPSRRVRARSAFRQALKTSFSNDSSETVALSTQDAEGLGKICESIDQLTGQITQANQAFCEIACLLVSLRDLVDVLPKKPKVDATAQKLRRLSCDWEEFHKTFKQLCWDSRRSAGTARLTMEDISDHLIPFLRQPGLSLEGKKMDLKQFSERLNRNNMSAQNITQSFVELAQRIDNYHKHSWDAAIKDVKSLTAWSWDRIICPEIKELDKSLQRITIKVKVLDIISVILSLGASLCGVLGGLQPLVHVGAAIGAASTSARESCTSQKEETQRAISEKLTLKHSWDKVLDNADQNSSQAFSKIGDGLGAISEMWSVLGIQMHQLDYWLDRCDGDWHEEMLRSTLTQLNSSKNIVSAALARYERITV